MPHIYYWSHVNHFVGNGAFYQHPKNYVYEANVVYQQYNPRDEEEIVANPAIRDNRSQETFFIEFKALRNIAVNEELTIPLTYNPESGRRFVVEEHFHGIA